MLLTLPDEHVTVAVVTNQLPRPPEALASQVAALVRRELPLARVVRVPRRWAVSANSGCRRVMSEATAGRTAGVRGHRDARRDV
jgi:hypothetical protein